MGSTEIREEEEHRGKKKGREIYKEYEQWDKGDGMKAKEDI